MENKNLTKVRQLMQKGVQIRCPASVEIGPEVDPTRISSRGVTIYGGCKIFGAKTLILEGCKIGHEAPVTMENCQLGPQVALKGGFFKEAVFLSRATAGLGAHVREGTIFEEQAGIAHTVGLKQTILFPFVTLGSLINFCDCLMAGGTSRKNHSEVGSAYIHFNFTPGQDKATASLIGDVPRGVMLDQSPIFLGGLGGLVGPCRLTFGTTVAAGTIVRKDELRPGRLLFGGAGKGGSIPFAAGRYRNDQRVVTNNIIYIANLMALTQWYRQVRSQFVSTAFPEALLEGVSEKLDLAIAERCIRLKDYGRKLGGADRKSEDRSTPPSATAPAGRTKKQALYAHWSELEGFFEDIRNTPGDQAPRDLFLEKIQQGISESGKDYIAVIKGLGSAERKTGTRWLQTIVETVTTGALKILQAH